MSNRGSFFANSYTMPQQPFSHSIPVTLTSIKDPHDVRHLNVTRGTPTPIGRASKSSFKNLAPSPTNALFDCPVVSRAHAELKLDPSKSPGDQVTIIDKKSAHGTQINGRFLEPFRPWSLRSGDCVQFGLKVTRGQDTHDGVIVTFANATPATQSTHTYIGTSPIGRTSYGVPDESDYESDFVSEAGFSTRSDDGDGSTHNKSSAKTTPEQNKAKLGSQEQPIDVESMSAASHPKIVTIEDDDEDMAPPSAQRPSWLPRYADPVFRANAIIQRHTEAAKPAALQAKPSTLVQNSIDRAVESLVPDSVPTNHHVPSPGPDTRYLLDSAMKRHGFGPLLNDNAETESERGEDDDESNHEIDYPDGEDEYDEDASDLDGSEVDSVNDWEPREDEEVLTYSAKKAVSPELGSAIPSQSAVAVPHVTAPLRSGPFDDILNPSPLQTPRTATRPLSHYETARTSSQMEASASQPYSQSRPRSSYIAPSEQTPVEYRFFRPCDTDPWARSIPDLSSHINEGRIPATTAQAYSPLWPNVDEDYSPQSPNLQHLTQLATPVFPFAQGSANTQVFDSLKSPPPPAPANLSAYLRDAYGPKATETTNAKAKMGISHITNDEADVWQGIARNHGFSLTKRKADVISSNDVPRSAGMISDDFPPICSPITPTEEGIVTLPLHDNLGGRREEGQEPPVRRRKVEHVTAPAQQGNGTVAEVAKYAVGAAAGGVGMVAFLCSPLAERLLEWLA